MEFSYTNNERKIQRVDLETGIVYGRKKPSGLSYHPSFGNEGSYSALFAQLWQTELQILSCSSWRKQS